MFGHRPLSYGDFSRTGVQDCQNAVSIDEFDYDGGGTAEEIVARTWAQWEDDGIKEQWFEQNDDFENLDPEKCYQAWASGWRGRAVDYVEQEMKRRKRQAEEDAEENPAGHPYYVDDGSGSLVPEHASFEAALSDAMTRVMRGNDPSVQIVTGSELDGFDDVATVLPLELYGSRHSIGEIPDSTEVVVIVADADLVPDDFAPGHTADVEYGPARGRSRDMSTVAFIALSDELQHNPPTVSLKKLFAWRPKVEQTIVDVHEGRRSYSGDAPIMVSRLDSPRGAFWIMDGHHRAVEAVLAGKSRIAIAIEPAVPRIERTGGAYKNVLDDRVNVAEFVERHAHENPPPKWWHRPSPKPRANYRTKADALKAFLDTNSAIVEGYGGADYKVSPSEFDSINHKYDLTGKKAVRTIADAVWVAMPMGKPYALDRIDLDALNDTSPAREAGVPFRLPDINYELQAAAEEAAYYASQQQEPERVFTALPSMDNLVPIALTLEEQEPGVATYRISNPAGKTKPIATSWVYKIENGRWMYRLIVGDEMVYSQDSYARKRDATAALKEKVDEYARRAREIRPIRLKLETSEPGVESYQIIPNPCACANPGDCTQAVREYLASVPRELHTEDDAVEALVEVGYKPDEIRAAYRAVTGTSGPVENPAWVTKILSKHFVELQEEVPPKWLPKLTKPGVQHGKLVASMKEYGCGAYGCVLPTLDKSVVLKLTTDDTEAEFAHQMASKLTAPVVVKYHLVRALPDRYRGRGAYLLWRDSADHVGQVEQAIAEEGGTDPRVVEKAINAQHKAAQDAFEALHFGKPAEKLIERWVDAAKDMGRKVPELRELADGMITNLKRNNVFMGDVHSGNIGLVNGHWVVVDPGHIAVLTS